VGEARVLITTLLNLTLVEALSIVEATGSSDLAGEGPRALPPANRAPWRRATPALEPSMSKSACFASFLLLLALPVAADVEKTTGTRNGKPYLRATEHQNITAIVVSIDKTSRLVKMRTDAGDTLAAVVQAEVKNFDQIRVGDLVKASITKQLSIEVASSSEMKDSYEVSGTSGKPGEKPHGTMTEKTRSTATITAINKTTGVVTLKGQDGNAYTVTAQNKENLNKVKIGDVVIFTVTRSVAASVERLTK
jgi:ribosomal protein S17